MKIYNLGSLNIDYVYSVEHFVTAGETLQSESMNVFPGGKGLNQSVALSRAGVKVVHGGCVGNKGEFLIDILNDSGVDTERIRKLDTSSGHAIIQIDKNGQNSILLFSGANYQIDKEYAEEFLRDATAGDILLLQNEINCLKEIFVIAAEKKMTVAFNPSPYHEKINNLPLDDVKLWFCNEIEAKALFGGETPSQITECFITKYPESSLVLTLGEQGSVFKDAKREITQEAYKVETVDTTAAGDTFTGYFLSAFVEGREIEGALDIASKAAAITVSREGASKSIPWKNELE